MKMGSYLDAYAVRPARALSPKSDPSWYLSITLATLILRLCLWLPIWFLPLIICYDTRRLAPANGYDYVRRLMISSISHGQKL